MLCSLSIVRATGLEKSKTDMLQEDLAELAGRRPAKSSGLCERDRPNSSRARSPVACAFRSWLAPRQLSARAWRTLLRVVEIVRAQLLCEQSGMAWRSNKRCHLAAEHGHPPANLPNRFGGQQKS